ncbi:MAG: TonB-dependent receptor [Deltaproteobacteria bacterium]|nr:TonB-dependent receptor [Deltaproteobacteria bacterium]MCL5891927.1 TonB-dependent receptor [Deltaproteobacteria bacterium]
MKLILLKRKTKNDFLIVLASTFILIFMMGLSKSCYAKKPVYLGEAAIKAKMKKKKEEQKKKLFKSAYTVSHITKKEIAATQNPMMGIVNVLNQKPSIYSYSAGPNGVHSEIEMRGFNGGQITEEFDGIPLNNLFSGSSQSYNLTYNNIPFTLGDVSSINIYRGINNPSVNSFNSLGGTINFNPLMPSRKFGASIFGGWGNFATTEYGASINSGKLPYGVKMYLRVTKNNSNGWVQNSNDKNTSIYMSIIKPYNMNRSNISFIYIRNDNQDNNGYNNSNVPLPLLQNYGYTFNYPTDIENDRLNNESWYAILGWNDYINRRLRFLNKAFYHYNHSYIVSYYTPLCSSPQDVTGVCSPLATIIPQSNGQPVQPYYIPNYAPNPYDLYMSYQNEYGDTPSFIIKAPRNKVTVGGQFLIGTEDVQGYYINNSGGTINSGATTAFIEYDTRANNTVFIQDKISIIPKKFYMEPGLKYNIVNTYDSEDPEGYTHGGTVASNNNFFEPSLGLSYNLLKNWVIYGAWGKIQKVANIGAYYPLLDSVNASGAFATPTMKPEYITDYEIGSRFKYNKLKLSANVYKEDFQNTFSTYKDLAFNPPYGITETYNAGNSMYEGIELEAGYKINRISGIFANWSYNTAIYTSNYEGPYGSILSGEHLSYVPRHLANLGGYVNIFKTYLKLWGTYSGEQYINDMNGAPTNLAHIGGYWIFNGYVSHYFNFKHIEVLKNAQLKGVEVSLSVDNILNRNYYPYALINYNSKFTPEYTYESVTPGMPRFVMVNATVKF